MSLKVSENADRALLFFYILEQGLPDERESGIDARTTQIRIFRKISGLSEFDALAAFAELEDIDMIG